MDNLAIKTSHVSENAAGAATTRDKTTSLEKLANTFRQLVTTQSATFDTGLNSISQQAGISGIAKQTDTFPSGDDYRQSTNESVDRSSTGRSEHRDGNRNDVSGRDHRDDAPPRQDSADPAEARDANASDRRGDDPGNHNSNEPAPGDNDRADSASDSQTKPDNSASNSDGTGAEKTDQSGADNQPGTQQATDSVASNTHSQQAAVAGASAGLNVGNSLAAGTTKSDVVNKGTAEAAQQNTAQTGSGLQAAAKSATNQSAGTHSHNGPQNAAAAGANQAQAQAQSEVNGRSGSAAQQQAQQIAKSLNPNDKVQINVTAGSDAETLTSKPSAALTSGTVLAAGDGKGSSQSTQHNANGQAASGQSQSVAANVQMAQAAQNQNQNQQNTNQNNQAQAQLQSASAGKAAASGAASLGGAATHAGGGEAAGGVTGSAAAGGTSPLSQQSQQAQQAQTETLNKEAPKGQSVTDQVSVKISKALQAGNDRISIQLKPSELGRVDVKMELTHDGRVMAVVTADNKDTLDLLRRDSADLQRSLEEAGLKLDSGDLSFNMRGEEGEMMADGSGTGTPGGADDGLMESIDDLILAQDTDVISDSRIDVKA